MMLRENVNGRTIHQFKGMNKTGLWPASELYDNFGIVPGATAALGQTHGNWQWQQQQKT